jgi:hypothetical protein
VWCTRQVLVNKRKVDRRRTIFPEKYDNPKTPMSSVRVSRPSTSDITAWIEIRMSASSSRTWHGKHVPPSNNHPGASFLPPEMAALERFLKPLKGLALKGPKLP